MPSDTQTTPISKKMLWTGRIMNALVVLFLLMDGVMKLFNPAPVVEGMTKLGYPLSLTAVIGIVLRRDLADRLSGRRSRQPTASWFAFVQQRLVPGLYGRADLGRAFLAR